MRKVILIIGLIGFSFLCRAQGNDYGYLGKKNLVSFFGTGSVRALALLDDWNTLGIKAVEFDDNNQIDFKNIIFRYDVRASYARLLGSKIYLGAECSYQKIQFTRTTYSNYSSSYNYNPTSTPVMNGYGTMLTLTFNSSDGLAPLGFASTIGIGPRFYTFDFNQNYRFDSENAMNEPYPDYANNMIGINAFWQLSVRKMLTRFLVIEYGVRIQSGYVFKNSDLLNDGTIFEEDYYSENPVWSKDMLVQWLREENRFNLLSFRLGLGFMF